MKNSVKIIIAFLIMFPFSINAATYKTDITGAKVAPSSGSGGSTCTATNYYVGFYTASYALQGIRVSYYNDEGKQVGNTVDVWVWGPAFYYAKNYTKLSESDGFIYYYKESNHSRYYNSRVDYSKGAKFELDGGKYYFYYDTQAMKESSILSCVGWDKTARRCKQYNVVEKGPLFYSLQDSNKSLLRNYLLREDVWKRYLKLAEADSLVDIEVGDYVMLIEPVVHISACVRGTYAGKFTATEVGKLYAMKSIGLNNTLKTVPGWLAVSSNATISGVTYTKTNVLDKNGNPKLFNGNEFAGNTGVGMSVIYGTEYCNPCKDSKQKYQIVYRTVDLANPFLDIGGNKRSLTDDSNWYQKQSTIDTSVYRGTPKYMVTLTPTKIKQIRNNNKTVNYLKIIEKYNHNSTFKTSTFKSTFGL